MRKQAHFCKHCHNPIAYDLEYREYYHLDSGLYGCPGFITDPRVVATPGGKASK